MFKKARFVLISVICFLISVISGYAQEESITFTTYYPSPYGVYREMRAQRMAIGDDYIKGGTTASGGYDWDTYDGDPWNSIDYTADLVVQGNVGIGTTNPGAKLHLGGTPGPTNGIMFPDGTIQTTSATGGTYTGGESVTFPNGLIIKFGRKACSANAFTVTFGTSFPTAAIAASALGDAPGINEAFQVSTLNTTTFSAQRSGGGTTNNAYWFVIGY